MFPEMIIVTLLTYVLSALAAECTQDITYKNGMPSPEPRIMNGFPVEDGMYPFVVAIFESGEHVCGGTILSSDTVITAARCVDKSGNYTVVAGTVDICKEGIRRKIERIILHPYYKFDLESGDVVYNLAVAKLKSALPSFLYPVKFPSDNMGVPLQIGTALGWGLIRKATSTNILRAVRLFQQSCDVAEYYFCVGHPYEARDVCAGDTGGPFIINETLFGIISHNQVPDCFGDFPSVLVNVTYFKKWIQESVGKLF